jgi:predicted Holliday junction resolvase-like endonuclease
MMKFLLLIVILFFALGLASLIMKRLANISARIADLHGDLKRNEMKLDTELQKLQNQQTTEKAVEEEKIIEPK